MEEGTLMNTENLIKFCEALESGEYPQDPDGGYLRTEQGYCCLGVLEEVRGVGFRKDVVFGYVRYRSNDGGKTGLPVRAAVTEFLGLPNYLDYSCHDTTVASIKVAVDGEAVGVHSLNDQGVSFRQIAALIRQEYNLPPA